MNEALETAFLVFAVGMLTVFAILSLVVLTGNALIHIINGLSTEKVSPTPAFLPQKKSISPKKLAAITAAVQQTTGGKGTITEVRKID